MPIRWSWLACLGVGVTALLLVAGGMLDSFVGWIALVVLLGGSSGKGWPWQAVGVVAACAAVCCRAGVGWMAGIEATVLILSVGVGMGGVAQALHPLRGSGNGQPMSEAAAVAFGLAWLTLPLWFPFGAAHLDVTRGLIAVHPIFAMNSLLQPLGIWTELPLPYRWIRLGQDVPYALPGSVWPAVGLNCAVAGVGLLVARAGRVASLGCGLGGGRGRPA